jgi:signal transduction histidine kinase
LFLDRKLFAQAISNLIANATKYNKIGGDLSIECIANNVALKVVIPEIDMQEFSQNFSRPVMFQCQK